MTPLIDNVWDLLTDEYKAYSQGNPNFKFNQSKKDDFKQLFSTKYDDVMTKYMDTSVKYLDRHKVAALIIISLLEIDVISYESLDEDCLFIGAELLALKVGLAYMVEKLNEKLSSKGIEKKSKILLFLMLNHAALPIWILCAETCTMQKQISH